MRARRGLVVGWAVVVAYAGLCVAVAVSSLTAADSVGGADAASSLVRAWSRSRTATYVLEAAYERRAERTGATLRSTFFYAQRPPSRVVRQFGGVSGRVDDQPLLCGAAPEGSRRGRCILGNGGRTFDESLAHELEVLESYFAGADPLYRVVDEGNGCFTLRRQHDEPLASYGATARLCFDDDTGAAREIRIDHGGGIIDTTTATSIRAEVTDDDLAYDDE